MDRHTARYIYEHRLLPHWLFDLKEKFVMSMIKNPSIIYEMLQGTFDQNGVECPYQKEQFIVTPGRFTDSVTVIKLTFPEPEEHPLCYAAFIFFDEDFQSLSYITVEKRDELSEDDNLPLFAWEPGKKHFLVGECKSGGMNDFKVAADYYMKRYGAKKEE